MCVFLLKCKIECGWFCIHCVTAIQSLSYQFNLCRGWILQFSSCRDWKEPNNFYAIQLDYYGSSNSTGFEWERLLRWQVFAFCRRLHIDISTVFSNRLNLEEHPKSVPVQPHPLEWLSKMMNICSKKGFGTHTKNSWVLWSPVEKW